MEDETVVANDDRPAASTDHTAPERTLRRRIPLNAVVIALLVAAVLAESFLLFTGNSAERKRTEVLGVARPFLVVLTTYNSTSLDAQRRRVVAASTGKFSRDYDTQLTGSGILATLRERQADSRGSIVRSAVTSLEGDSATVLAVMRVAVTNKDIKTPRVENPVLELSLVQTTSGWKIDSVTLVGNLTS
jgi:Mce-associated membrane protein